MDDKLMMDPPWGFIHFMASRVPQKVPSTEVEKLLCQSAVEVSVTITGGGVTSYNDLTDKPTLGTASSKDSGTGAGEVLLLSENNKLPALDGSLLTNISGSGGEFDRAIVQAMITAGVTI